MSNLLDEKVMARSLVDVVAERIEAAIVSGALEPGSRLSEQAMATSLGVSRGPLREAIRRLEGRKLLERTPNIGVRVAALSLQDFHQILQIREALEGLACALAAQNMTDAEIAGLQKLLGQHEQQKSVREGKGYYPESKDLEFHSRIANASRNERLVQLLYGDHYYLLRIYRHKLTPKPGRAMKALQEHKAIVEALARRDPVAAEQKMREHLRNARMHVEAHLTATQAAPEAPAVQPRRSAKRIGSLGPPSTRRR
jgi:DNA-binding GntR family transcriptional regulator